ncbi:hypothetical protein ACI65C_000911 [Semiaphis heraclei]
MKTINFAISFPIIVLLFLIIPITLVFKWIVSLAHRIVCLGVLGNVMTNDEIRWLGGSWRHSTVFAIFILDNEMELKFLQQLVVSKVLPQCPRLTEKPVVLTNLFGNSHCWMSDRNSFDINQHVFKSCENTMEKHELQRYIGQLVSGGLSIDKPPWELHLLSQRDEVMPGKRDAVVVFLAHRCLADWISLAKLLCTCLSDTKPYYHTSENPTKIRYLTSVVRTVMTGPAEILWKMITPINDDNIVTPDSLSLNYNISWSCFQGALSKVNRINQVTKTPNSDVVLSAIAGSLHVMMKVIGLQQLDNMNIVYPVQTGNTDHSSPVLIRLPIGVEGAIPRLWFTKKAMQNMYQSDQALLPTIVSLLMPLHSSGTRTLLSGLTDNLACLQFSWVSGPRSRIIIKGSPLKTVYSVLPSQKSIGVSVSVFTYTDDIFISVSADRAIGEGFGETLLLNIKRQIDQMYELLRYRRIPKDLKSSFLISNNFKDLSSIDIEGLMKKMKDIQLQLQMAKELGVYNDDGIRHVNHLRGEYSILLRELRKRKHKNKRNIVQKILGCSNHFNTKLNYEKEETKAVQATRKLQEATNIFVAQTAQDYRPKIHICKSTVYAKDNFLGLPKLPREQLLTQI